MNRCLTVALLGLIFLSLAACSRGGGDKPIVIKFSHVSAPESAKGKAVVLFAELAGKKTNGKAKVEVYPSSQLYGDNDELDALIAGNVHMIAPSVTKMVKLDPRWQFVDMPFLFRDQQHVHQFFQSDLAWGLLTSDKLTNNGIMGLTFWENGFKNFSNSKKQLRTPADLKGLKFRTQAGKVLEAQFKALDAGSATITFGETYAALQQGIVDGQENTFNTFDTQKYEEVQKYLTISEHGRLDYAIFVNKRFWEGMPHDIRAQVEEALKEATEYEWRQAGEDNVKSFENLKKNGKVEMVELTPAERAAFIKALQPVYDQFSSVITPELIDGIRNMK